MNLQELSLPDFCKKYYQTYTTLTPIQGKAIEAGVLEGRSLLVCAPTASGKTLVATMALAKALESKRKVLYVVPLKALASEKYKEYQKLLSGTPYSVTLSTGEIEVENNYLRQYDLLILTAEKLDSLLRHPQSWLSEVKTVIIDEIHLLNDPARGPTVEIIITLLKMLISPQLMGLSATIGNPQELASWLEATLVQDSWRPVELKQGIYCNDKLEFY